MQDIQKHNQELRKQMSWLTIIKCSAQTSHQKIVLQAHKEIDQHHMPLEYWKLKQQWVPFYT